jgi:uncharacterized membrane protein YkgB
VSTTSTLAELLKTPSLTVSWNVSVVWEVTRGAVYEGVGVLVLEDVLVVGPAVCVQE